MKKTMAVFIKSLLLILLIMIIHNDVIAQVTIGSGVPPHDDALLDLKENSGGTATKGLLLPRVALTDASLPAPMINHVAGMTVYNTAVSPTDGSVTVGNYVSPGFYYNDGSRWQKLYLGTKNWFYMPSIVIDVTASGTFERDLYLEYRKQFEDGVDSSVPNDSPVAGTPLVKSPDAPNPFTKIFDADELYYYITGYDTSVFSNLTVTATGKLLYTVDADEVTDATYMNIVFVEK